MGDRPRPHLSRRPKAAHGHLGLRRPRTAAGAVRRRRACADRAGPRRAGPLAGGLDQSRRDPGSEAAPSRRARSRMAFPRADLGLVDSMAAAVTICRLVPFPDFMGFLRVLVCLPVWLVLIAAANAPS